VLLCDHFADTAPIRLQSMAIGSYRQLSIAPGLANWLSEKPVPQLSVEREALMYPFSGRCRSALSWSFR